MTKMLIKGVPASESPLLNDNICVVGGSGTGKTTLFVDTQIHNSEGSIIVSDTKSNLYRKHKETLEEKGYDVKLLDFIDFEKSTVGYNPFDYLDYDSKRGTYDEGAVDRLVYSICPTLPDDKEPFWISSARLLISTVIGYTLDMLTDELSNNNNLTYASCLLASTNITMMQEQRGHMPAYVSLQIQLCKSLTIGKWLSSLTDRNG